MEQADQFVLGDDVQYTTHSFTNRNRIKNINGCQWLTIPVLTKGKGFQEVRDVKIDNTKNWQKKHWKSILINYKYSIYFDNYADFFWNLYQKNWTFLIDLNIAILDFIKDRLSITCPIVLNSELKIKSNSSERILEMSQKINCNCYLAGTGGSIKYLNDELFQKSGIDLVFCKFRSPVYRQQFGTFIPNLSVIDLLFNEGEEAREILLNNSNPTGRIIKEL